VRSFLPVPDDSVNPLLPPTQDVFSQAPSTVWQEDRFSPLQTGAIFSRLFALMLYGVIFSHWGLGAINPSRRAWLPFADVIPLTPSRYSPTTLALDDFSIKDWGVIYVSKACDFFPAPIRTFTCCRWNGLHRAPRSSSPLISHLRDTLLYPFVADTLNFRAPTLNRAVIFRLITSWASRLSRFFASDHRRNLLNLSYDGTVGVV